MNVAPASVETADIQALSLSRPLEVEPAEVARWVDVGDALLVDVREVSEYENERIPGAMLMPLSFFNAKHFPRVRNMKVVLYCAVGKRSVAAGKQLLRAGFPQAISMKGGLNAWKAEGLLVEQD